MPLKDKAQNYLSAWLLSKWEYVILLQSTFPINQCYTRMVGSQESLEEGSKGVNKRNLSTDALNYEQRAVQKLNSLQSNSAVIAASLLQGRASHVSQASKVEATTKYLSRIGVSLDQLDALSIIHIAGTKGKGTTAALCESILRKHGYKTGFFSSPHLVQARERIRLNGVPLSSRQFAEHVETIYSKLNDVKENDADMPAYFKFLTVMAFHIFLKEQVDVAIIEVGIGGEYDCTNCIRKPSVVGVTTLGLDHTSILGTNLTDIAWQKAGIFKPGTRAFTVPQSSPAAMEILRDRAINRQCSLKISPPLESYVWASDQPFLPMVEDVYSTNASLALQMTNAWLQLQSPFWEEEEKINYTDNENVPMASPFTITHKMSEGLNKCTWPGRTQVLRRGPVTYFLDGAHTEESISYCIKWFLAASSMQQTEPENIKRILVFNTTGDRAQQRFLSQLIKCNFGSAIFPEIIAFPNQTNKSDLYSLRNTEKESGLHRLQAVWKSMGSKSESVCTNTVNEAIEKITAGNAQCHVLITGSVYLVGAALSVLDPNLQEPTIRIPANLRPLENVYSGLQAIL